MSDRPERRRRKGIRPFDFEIRISGLFGREPFSMRISPEGIRTEGLEKIRGIPRPGPAEEREPLVDVIEEEGEVKVVAELPGVEKEKIELTGTETGLTISTESPYGKYHKDVDLPVQVDPKSAKATYKNRMLEIRLAKTAKKPKGERI